MEGSISALSTRSSFCCYFSSSTPDSQLSLSPSGFRWFEKFRPVGLAISQKGGRRTSSVRLFLPPIRGSLSTPGVSAEEETVERSRESTVTSMPKIDRSGRFCSPRAARELALLIIYASCLEGSDPIRLFERRINAKREPGYEFDKASLLEYNHMSFGGPPVKTKTDEEADELQQRDEKESMIEAEVLSAPPKLVYSKLILRFARKLLVAVADKWDNHVLDIENVAPSNWKNEPAGRILEFSILHLAMSEISVLGTRHQIVINEAVDLAKRFCDGSAPRIINGCLRTYVNKGTVSPKPSEIKQETSV